MLSGFECLLLLPCWILSLLSSSVLLSTVPYLLPCLPNPPSPHFRCLHCRRLNGSTLHRLSSLHQLHSLDISYVFSMPHFPPELCELTALRTLVVKCVYVHSIPR